nr:hypothetical protein [uncultured Tolumonas sp.]
MTSNSLNNKKQTIIGFILLSITIYICYLFITKIWSIFSSINPTLGAGLIAASGTIVVTLISVLVSKHLERKAHILSHLREKKVPTYEKIIEFIFRITFSEKIGKTQPTEAEMIKFMAEITQELVIWGSDEMIDAFYKFRMKSIENASGVQQSPHEILFTVESLLLAIRKDLGHQNKNMPKGKLLGLFINDVII